MNNKKDQHTISLVSKLAKSGDVMINIEDGIIKVNSIKDGVKKTKKSNQIIILTLKMFRSY